MRKGEKFVSDVIIKWQCQRLPWHHLVTGNASIGKKMLVDTGMYDEDFKGYGCEDYELGYRIAKKHIPIIIIPML
jgi:predicted glycosyltransferase involved in capsule biosynthesis